MGFLTGLQRLVPDIGLPEGEAIVGQAGIEAELPDERRHPPEMPTREPSEQVVLHLELQASVEPVHPRIAQDVQRPHRLLLEPFDGPRWSDVDARGEVVEAELYVLDPCHREAHQHEQAALPPPKGTRSRTLPAPKSAAQFDADVNYQSISN